MDCKQEQLKGFEMGGKGCKSRQKDFKSEQRLQIGARVITDRGGDFNSGQGLQIGAEQPPWITHGYAISFGILNSSGKFFLSKTVPYFHKKKRKLPKIMTTTFSFFLIIFIFHSVRKKISSKMWANHTIASRYTVPIESIYKQRKDKNFLVLFFIRYHLLHCTKSEVFH